MGTGRSGIVNRHARGQSIAEIDPSPEGSGIGFLLGKEYIVGKDSRQQLEVELPFRSESHDRQRGTRNIRSVTRNAHVLGRLMGGVARPDDRHFAPIVDYAREDRRDCISHIGADRVALVVELLQGMTVLSIARHVWPRSE
jgi:hypothetical protein